MPLFGESHNCPRGIESGRDGATTWKSRHGKMVCGWCGSLEPDTFMQLAKAGIELGPTDKNYKVYVQDGHQKFYFQHLSVDQKNEFLELLQQNRLNIGYPGHFYRLPFFITLA